MNPLSATLLLGVPTAMVGVGIALVELPDDADVPGWQGQRSVVSEQSLSRQQAQSMAAFRDDVLSRFRPNGNPLRPPNNGAAAGSGFFPDQYLTPVVAEGELALPSTGVATVGQSQWRYFYDTTYVYVYPDMPVCAAYKAAGCARQDLAYYVSLSASANNPAQIGSPYVGALRGATRRVVNHSFEMASPNSGFQVPASMPLPITGAITAVTTGSQFDGMVMWVTRRPDA